MAAKHLFLFAAFAYMSNFVQPFINKAPCQPRPIAIPTRNGSKSFTQSHILLHRCSGGGTKSDEYYMCVENETEEVKTKLRDSYEGHKVDQSFLNHTKCMMMCYCEKNGHKCPIRSAVYTPKCPPEQTWDKSTCQCRSIHECPEESTGGGGISGGVSISMFVTALVIEFIVVLIVVFLVLDVCKYRRHSTGIIFKTSQYIRHISNGETGGFRVPTLKRERDATGSVSFLYDVNNGNGPYEKVAV